MTTAAKTKGIEAVYREGWTELGMTENVQDDLIGIAGELAGVYGKDDLGDALRHVDTKAREVIEAKLMSRVRDTIDYNGDLEKR